MPVFYPSANKKKRKRKKNADGEIIPDGKVLGLDVTQMHFVREVVVEVLHHVQEAERDAVDLVPGGPRPPTA